MPSLSEYELWLIGRPAFFTAYQVRTFLDFLLVREGPLLPPLWIAVNCFANTFFFAAFDCLDINVPYMFTSTMFIY